MGTVAEATRNSAAAETLPHTLLFYGDSITRGFGIGRQTRFPARLEAAFRTHGKEHWRVAVAYGRSFASRYREGIDTALLRYRPRILFCQCPIGGMIAFPTYPLWIRILQRLFGYFFNWRRERLIRRELESDSSQQRTRNHVIYEGTYLQELHRFKPSVLPGLRALRKRLVSGYVAPPQMSAGEYAAFIGSLDQRARELGVETTVFLGLLPMRGDYYQGYRERAVEWNRRLAALHDPQNRRYFLDIYAELAALPDEEMLLLDGTHPSQRGHEVIADLLLPRLLPLLK